MKVTSKKVHKPRGAPRKDTPDAKASVLQAFSDGKTIREAAWSVGVHPRTLSNWRNDDADFDKACYAALTSHIDRHLAFMKQAAYEHHNKYAMIWMSNRMASIGDGPERDKSVDNWYEKQEKSSEA